MKNTTWICKGGRALGPAPFFVSGIVNATPDSFYDGGRHDAQDAAVAHALKLAAEGAKILDIGGESTRPYADAVSEREELDRVVPVITHLNEMDWADVADEPPVLSVDTYKARVAAAALEAGAVMVNDVSAFRFEPELLDVVAEYKPAYVLMHSLGRPEEMQDAPQYSDTVGEIMAFFEERLNLLSKAGLPEDRIALDPGIGFGKELGHNLDILRELERFTSFGLPVYMGLSNKSLWEKLLGLGVDERRTATQVGTAVSAMRGASIHRVHEVLDTVRTLTIVHNVT